MLPVVFYQGLRSAFGRAVRQSDFVLPPTPAGRFPVPIAWMIVPRRRLLISIPSPPPSPRPNTSRAPPPSPCDEAAAKGEGAGLQFDAYLRRATVPSLVLSGAVYQRRKTTSHPLVADDLPPVIDLAELTGVSGETGQSAAAAAMKAAARSLGCFQLANHGLSTSTSKEAIMAASAAAGVIAEPGCSVSRGQSEDEDSDVDDADDSDDDVVYRWSKGGEQVRETVAGTSVEGHYDMDMSAKMDALLLELERVAREVTQVLHPGPVHDYADLAALHHNDSLDPPSPSSTFPSTLSFHDCKRRIRSTATGDCNSSSSTTPSSLSPLHHGDAIRMLVQGSRAASSSGRWGYTLCLHLCCGASGFQIYNGKRGWSSFRPNDGAIVVTVGNQLQVCSDGLYQQAVGKPILHTTAADELACPSSSKCSWVSFQYHHSQSAPVPGLGAPAADSRSPEKVISLLDQLLIAACLALLYHFVVAWLQ